MSSIKKIACFFIGFALFFQFDSGLQHPTDRLETEEIESKIFGLINGERAKRGILPLELSRSLTVLARIHSQDMATQSELTHDAPDGISFSQRLQKAGSFSFFTEIPRGNR